MFNYYILENYKPVPCQEETWQEWFNDKKYILRQHHRENVSISIKFYGVVNDRAKPKFSVIVEAGAWFKRNNQSTTFSTIEAAERYYNEVFSRLPDKLGPTKLVRD
jgi:hypothetical protein